MQKRLLGQTPKEETKMQITVDASQLTDFISELPSKLEGLPPAIIDCMGDIYSQTAIDLAYDVFDNPSEYTINGIRVDYGDKWVSIYIKDMDDGEGRAVSRWMKTQIQGGPRPTTGYERRMLPGKYIMPGRHANFPIDIGMIIDLLEQGESGDLELLAPDAAGNTIRAKSKSDPSTIKVLGFVMDDSPQYTPIYTWDEIEPDWTEPAGTAIDEVFNAINL